MKFLKSIVWSAIIICTLSYFFIACKKNGGEVQPSASEKQEVLANTAGRFQDSVSVSPYGFLVFLSVDNLEDYRQFILTHTHRQVNIYLDSLGFTSIGKTKYNSSYAASTVTDAQFLDYILDTNYIFQVSDVVFKPIGISSCGNTPFDFFLTIRADNLNSTSFADLAEGIYNAESMNQFAFNASTIESPLFDFVDEIPVGHQETDPSCWTSTEIDGHPNWGWGSWSDKSCIEKPKQDWIDQNADGEPDQTFTRCREKSYYAAGIKLFTKTDCYAAWGCD